ncbi:MAG TPA: hypothetical protein VGL29_08485 [Blastocatellia bacterium]
MPNQKGKASTKKQAAGQRFDRERAQFRALILENPNYFGNLKKSKFKPELNIQLNTTFEEIGCVGFQPQASLVEAVVFINQPTGYGGDVCSNGTPEFVRFYLSLDGGATWQDQGLTSFTVFDVPGTSEVKRLEYAVTLPIQPHRRFCFFQNLAKVRAILSWNVPPPPNDPNFSPVWGDVHDTNIQIEPFRLFKFIDLLTELKLKLPEEVTQSIDLEQNVAAAKPKALSAAELGKLYKDKKVEPHRFALADVQKLVNKTSVNASLMSPGFAEALPNLGINLGDIIGKLFPVDGDTSFEQLECVGLSPDQSLLVGVIRVKLPNGYSGDPCTAGSKEFVTFWGDFDDNGTFETCLGTTSVNVYDINNIPKDGLEYAVFLPVDLNQYRQPCKKGPRVVKIRAILSWQVPPPCANPNFIPIWGNREETLILIGPGPKINPGEQVPLLTAVGDIIESKIDGAGFAQDAIAIHTGVGFDEAPFGGRITLAGKIVNGTAGSKYRIMRKTHGAPDTSYGPLTNEPTGIDITVNTWDIVNGLVQTVTTIHADADGYYDYQDYASDHFVESNILSVWFSTPAEDGATFDLRVDLKVDANPANDLHSNVVTVHVDNVSPTAKLDIDLGVGVECADFNLGAVFTGHYTASDAHFGAFSFVIRPPGPAHGVLPVPPAGSHGVIPAPGLSLIPDPGINGGTYTLNTAGMDACGYSLTLQVSDRTNVDSGRANNYNEASVGFCLRKHGG